MIRSAGGRASDDAIRSLVISYKLPGSRAGECIEWLTIREQRQAVLDDVLRIAPTRVSRRRSRSTASSTT